MTGVVLECNCKRMSNKEICMLTYVLMRMHIANTKKNLKKNKIK